MLILEIVTDTVLKCQQQPVYVALFIIDSNSGALSQTYGFPVFWKNSFWMALQAPKSQHMLKSAASFSSFQHFLLNCNSVF